MSKNPALEEIIRRFKSAKIPPEAYESYVWDKKRISDALNDLEDYAERDNEKHKRWAGLVKSWTLFETEQLKERDALLHELDVEQQKL